MISGAVLLNPIQNLRSNIIEKITGSLNDNRFASDKWTGSQPLLSLDEGSPMRGSSSLAASLERCGSMPSMFKNLKEASKSPLANEVNYFSKIFIFSSVNDAAISDNLFVSF